MFLALMIVGTGLFFIARRKDVTAGIQPG